MIVFDVSALVGAAIRQDGTPERALRHAIDNDRIAMSRPILAELADVFARPRLQRFVQPRLRDSIIADLVGLGVFFEPSHPVRDCRDPKDNMYLELALAAEASAIVSSDADLLVLHPWRGVRILLPADYLAAARPGV